MYLKLQSKGLAGGLNHGSCALYAYYLEHENRWKKAHGLKKEIIPFYDCDGVEVDIEDVISAIDANKSGLHVEDAKFFSLVISPSDNEAALLGAQGKEKIKSIKTMVSLVMDRYASGFGKDRISSHQDLLYFYTIHEYRDNEDGTLRSGIHAHIIISRKDKGGRFKLSPMTNHRGATSGIIRSGFDRDAFYRDCESIFDTTWGYERRIKESYDYLNAIAHGSASEKTAMIHAAVQEENIHECISMAIIRRATRLAAEAAREEEKLEQADKHRRNEFWNSYHSYYQPLLYRLIEQCEATFSLYSMAKKKNAAYRLEIDEQYRRILCSYNRITAQIKALRNASNTNELTNLFASIVFLINPLPILLLRFLLLMAQEYKRQSIKEETQDIVRMLDIINTLVKEQEKLKIARADVLKEYVKVKNEKDKLIGTIQGLKDELSQSGKKSTPSEQSAQSTVAPNSITDGKALDQVHSAFGLYGSVMVADTKLNLDIDLLTQNTIIEPVFHANGGVADLRVIIRNKPSLASASLSADKTTALLEKWCQLAGMTPAYRIAVKESPVKSLPTKHKEHINRNKAYGIPQKH